MRLTFYAALAATALTGEKILAQSLRLAGHDIDDAELSLAELKAYGLDDRPDYDDFAQLDDYAPDELGLAELDDS